MFKYENIDDLKGINIYQVRYLQKEIRKIFSKYTDEYQYLLGKVSTAELIGYKLSLFEYQYLLGKVSTESFFYNVYIIFGINIYQVRYLQSIA